MDRPEIERRTLAYLDEHDGEAVELLRGLVRVRSLAHQEGTARLPGTIVARLRPELGHGGVSEAKRSVRSMPIVYGRGSFDNKAAVASTAMAMRALAATGARLAGTVVAAYVADEEETGTGVHALCDGPESWLGSRGYLGGPRDANGFLINVSGVALDGS